MKVICLSCGFKIDLDQAYDDYDGLVKCFACGALLAVRTEAGSIKSMLLAAPASAVQPEHRREHASSARPTHERP